MSEEKEVNDSGSEAAEAPEAPEEAREPETDAESADSAASAEAETPAEEPAAEPEAAAQPEASEKPAEEAEAAAETPAYDYDTLHAMNVAELREVASKIEHDAVHGYTTMHKEHLLPAICKALGVEAHEHHEVVGIDKEGVKARIRALKKERDEAEAAGDKARLKLARRRIRGLKRKIRKATV